MTPMEEAIEELKKKTSNNQDYNPQTSTATANVSPSADTVVNRDSKPFIDELASGISAIGSAVPGYPAFQGVVGSALSHILPGKSLSPEEMYQQEQARAAQSPKIQALANVAGSMAPYAAADKIGADAIGQGYKLMPKIVNGVKRIVLGSAVGSEQGMQQGEEPARAVIGGTASAVAGEAIPFALEGGKAAFSAMTGVSRPLINQIGKRGNSIEGMLKDIYKTAKNKSEEIRNAMKETSQGLVNDKYQGLEKIRDYDAVDALGKPITKGQLYTELQTQINNIASRSEGSDRKAIQNAFKSDLLDSWAEHNGLITKKPVKNPDGSLKTDDFGQPIIEIVENPAEAVIPVKLGELESLHHSYNNRTDYNPTRGDTRDASVLANQLVHSLRGIQNDTSPEFAKTMQDIASQVKVLEAAGDNPENIGAGIVDYYSGRQPSFKNAGQMEAYKILLENLQKKGFDVEGFKDFAAAAALNKSATHGSANVNAAANVADAIPGGIGHAVKAASGLATRALEGPGMADLRKGVIDTYLKAKNSPTAPFKFVSDKIGYPIPKSLEGIENATIGAASRVAPAYAVRSVYKNSSDEPMFQDEVHDNKVGHSKHD